MKRFYLLIPVIILSLTIDACSQDSSSDAEQNKPRVIVMSDFPPLDVIPGRDCDGPAHKCSDPDDIQSMVRFLLYANEFEVEALIPSAATFANYADKQHILDILDRYDQVDENLRNYDPEFLTADYLRSVTYEGPDNTWVEPWTYYYLPDFPLFPLQLIYILCKLKYNDFTGLLNLVNYSRLKELYSLQQIHTKSI